VGRSDEEKRFSFEFPGKKSSYEREETVYKSFAWNYTGQDRRDDLSANAPGTTKNRSAFGLFIYTLHAAMCFSGGRASEEVENEGERRKIAFPFTAAPHLLYFKTNPHNIIIANKA
jgi:hypothetical protein